MFTRNPKNIGIVKFPSSNEVKKEVVSPFQEIKNFIIEFRDNHLDLLAGSRDREGFDAQEIIDQFKKLSSDQIAEIKNLSLTNSSKLLTLFRTWDVDDPDLFSATGDYLRLQRVIDSEKKSLKKSLFIEKIDTFLKTIPFEKKLVIKHLEILKTSVRNLSPDHLSVLGCSTRGELDKWLDDNDIALNDKGHYGEDKFGLFLDSLDVYFGLEESFSRKESHSKTA